MGEALSIAKYTSIDRARLYPEVHGNRRGDFERDRGRVIHSSALRRLSAKTGVFSPTAGLDFVRNRLTHTLEVAQVGREIGRSLGLNPNLVDTACLAHDLGHPPFGHNGEMALAEWALRIGGFEGNAQTLRILTRLEPKRFVDGASYGLNLTRASLDATIKYPWGYHAGQTRADRDNVALKYNVYEDDRAAFEWVREGALPGAKCIEAQVMDISDDIAYSVHDLEDGIVERYVDPAFIDDPLHEDELIEGVVVWTGTQLDSDVLLRALRRLRAEPLWIHSWSAGRAHQAQLKDLMSDLIGRFCATTAEATRAAYPQKRLNRYQANVVVPVDTQAEIAVLKGIVGTFIMSSGLLRPYYERQREMLTALVEHLWTTGGRDLDPLFAEWWAECDDDRGRQRVVVDQVASLTDQSATRWFERLCK